jgi:hypothetical protein
MATDNRVDMAIARVVLKRRIEAPCGRSPGFNIFGVNDFEPWLTKEKCGNMAPRRAKDARAALTSVGPRGKASLLPLLRVTISGYHAEVPCLNS